MPIYMRIESVRGDAIVSGKSRPGKYDKWIELDSMTFHKRSNADGTGTITVHKKYDLASSALNRLAGGAMDGMNVRIHFVKDGTSNTYLRHELESVYASDYSVGSGGGTPTETLSFIYMKASTKH